MISVRLDETIEGQLDALSKSTKRSKSFYVQEALRLYMEDMQDYYEARQRSNAPDRNLISLEALEASLGL